jgi:hypothetical protein
LLNKRIAGNLDFSSGYSSYFCFDQPRIIVKKAAYYSILFLFVFVGYQAFAQDQFYGDKISPEGAIPASELVAKIKSSDSIQVKVEGNVLASCKAKGCWMDMDLGNNQSMKVTFRDYGFFVPKGMSNQKVIVEGVAKKEVISVATLKHYAKDAGKSKSEIDAIKDPQLTITFEATGVIVKNEK